MPVVKTAPRSGFHHLRSNLHCCDDGSSNKVWALYTRDAKDYGPAVTVWGRLGGKMQISEYNGGASTDIPKFIQSKLAKGYKPYQGVAHPSLSASSWLSPETKR